MNAVAAALARHAAARPDACALSDGTSTMSYARLHDAVARATGALKETNGTIALALPNGLAWAVADLALAHAELPCLPLPPFFTPAQQAHALRDAGARYLMTDRPGDYEARLRREGIAVRRCSDLELGDSRVACLALVAPSDVRLPHVTAKITYTSGTTGTPKGVCLGLDALSAVSASLVDAVGLTARDRHLSILPLSTLLENVAGLYAPLAAGACVILPPLEQIGMTPGAACMPERLAHALAVERATTTITVPELLRALCSALERGTARAPSLRFVAVGGARTSPELLARAARAGLTVFEGYGLSECASVVALNTPGANRPGSVGRVLPHALARIARDGEIEVRGATLLGYANGTPPSGEWLPTGDAGRLDDEGFLYITGRRKNVFITSYGRNVSPEWVESELTAAPGIAQAWVHGEGRRWNTALITAEPGVPTATVEASVAAVNLRLPDYARIGKWMPSAEPFSPANGELTVNGRVRRDALLARYGRVIDQLYTEMQSDVS